MDESERLQRYKSEKDFDCVDENDEKLAERIMLLLNDPKIDKYCMVDAYYYDFSVIPRDIQQRLQLWRDVYLIYGINVDGEIVSKWVDRWDLDSSDSIIDGKVQHKPFDQNKSQVIPPEIMQSFNAKLLTTITPDSIIIFGKKD